MRRAVLVVFGGGSWTVPQGTALLFEYYNEIWAYDDLQGWRELDSTGFAGDQFVDITAVAREDNQDILMYGGRCGDGCYRNEVWSYSPADEMWIRLFSAT